MRGRYFERWQRTCTVYTVANRRSHFSLKRDVRLAFQRHSCHFRLDLIHIIMLTCQIDKYTAIFDLVFHELQLHYITGGISLKWGVLGDFYMYKTSAAQTFSAVHTCCKFSQAAIFMNALGNTTSQLAECYLHACNAYIHLLWSSSTSAQKVGTNMSSITPCCLQDQWHSRMCPHRRRSCSTTSSRNLSRWHSRSFSGYDHSKRIYLQARTVDGNGISISETAYLFIERAYIKQSDLSFRPIAGL